jgi:hypothetical protein
MGESKLKQATRVEALQRSAGLQTVAGKVHVRCNPLSTMAAMTAKEL